ncbi:hypothetical protein ACQKWADRAFT_322627 [Trichoderma austrokoningii]
MSSTTPTYILSPNWDIPADSEIVVLGPGSLGGKIGIWAKCLQAIRGQLSSTQLQSAAEDHTFDVLETKYFLPDDVYLEQAINDPGVQAYFQVCNRRKPVYLITGIKIAKDSKVTSKRNTERSAQAKLKVDATDLGAPIEVGPEASWESTKKSGISYAGMKPKRRGHRSSNESYVKGAVFGKEERGDAATPALKDGYDIEEEAGIGFSDTWESIETER